MKQYKLGNCLGSGFTGKFASQDEAWSQLGSRFLQAYPCDKLDKTSGKMVENPDGGRHVQLYVKEENPYGHEQYLVCRSEYFNMADRVPVTHEGITRLPDYCFL